MFLEGTRQIGGDDELAGLGVQFELDVDLIACGHPGLVAHRGADRELKLAPHPRDRRLIAVAGDRHSHAWPVAAVERGDDVIGDGNPGCGPAVGLDGAAELHADSLFGGLTSALLRTTSDERSHRPPARRNESGPAAVARRHEGKRGGLTVRPGGLDALSATVGVGCSPHDNRSSAVPLVRGGSGGGADRPCGDPVVHHPAGVVAPDAAAGAGGRQLLFLRRAHGVELTEAGRELLPKARLSRRQTTRWASAMRSSRMGSSCSGFRWPVVAGAGSLSPRLSSIGFRRLRSRCARRAGR
jgi:hypothetical protein